MNEKDHGKVGNMQPVSRRLATTLAVTTAVALVVAALLGGFALGRPSAAATQSQSQSRGGGAGTQLAADSSPSTTSGATITVTSTGQVSGTPDTLTLQIGVSATGSTASATLDQASTEMSTLQAVFLSHGVTHSQLQTSGLNVSPNYDSGGVITGYSANEELTVTLHDLSSAGALIDDASHAVGNFGHIDGIQFSISNTSALLAAARAQAMQNAHVEAQQLASGAGVSLGPIKSVTDEEQAPQPVYYGQTFAPAAASAGAAVPVQAGKQSLSIQVQVVYQLVK